MGRKKKLNKEEIAEDWCFACKDGGLLILCEYRDCLKAYHTECVGKEDSFLKTGKYSRCSWHNCFRCHKASKFQCFCCPNSVCGRCFWDAEFSVVKGNKGFCSHCLKLAQLVEENADVDSEGEKIDFEDRDTYEFYFSDYYKIIKEQEGWNSQQVHSAYNLLKNGKNYKCDGESNEMGEGDDVSDESEDNFVVSDDDGFNDTAFGEPVKKRKRRVRELKTLKEKEKDKKKEFIGWGSRGLTEFLLQIGKDTSNVLSQHDVCSIIIQYCKENRLFHPEKKKKILCDAKLKSLLGRKSVNKNSLYNLLTPHFADNCEEMEDDTTSGSEDGDKIESINCKKQRLRSSSISYEDLVSEGHQSCFAAIVSSNIKLVYLKRSLIEELLTQPETFDAKVIGSFVRVKSDPNDYLQKNSHQLLQVVGIQRPSKNNEVNKEILLHLSNVPIDVPICKVSDDDFFEEECQDLKQRMKDGLLSQPTVLKLEQKARNLHEDIIKHWIPRELAALQRRIDQANEKGWRRELSEYMDRKLLLQTQSEQSRLLNSRPKVIPDVLHMKSSPEPQDTPIKDELEVTPCKDKLEQNGLLKSVPGERRTPLGDPSKTTAAPETPAVNGQDYRTISASVEQSSVTAIVQEKCTPPGKQLQSSSKVMQVNTAIVLASEQLRLEPPTCNATSKSGLSQPRHSDSGSGCDGGKSDASMNSEQMTKENLKKKQRTPVCEMIVLSDDDEQDQNAQMGKETDENPENPIWHCVSPCGEKRGPFSLSLLKRWSETSKTALEFKVWKTGQSERDAILLPDALRQCLPENLVNGNKQFCV